MADEWPNAGRLLVPADLEHGDNKEWLSAINFTGGARLCVVNSHLIHIEMCSGGN